MAIVEIITGRNKVKSPPSTPALLTQYYIAEIKSLFFLPENVHACI